MKVFQTFEELFTWVVVRKISSTPKSVKIHGFGLKNYFFFFGYLISFGSLITFLCVEVESFNDVLETVFSLVTSIGNMCNLFFLFFNGAKILQLIDNFDDIIQERKWIEA